MPEIHIHNNVIRYQVEEGNFTGDTSWEMKLDAVAVIGGINQLKGDEDSFFSPFWIIVQRFR